MLAKNYDRYHKTINLIFVLCWCIGSFQVSAREAGAENQGSDSYLDGVLKRFQELQDQQPSAQQNEAVSETRDSAADQDNIPAGAASAPVVADENQPAAATRSDAQLDVAVEMAFWDSIKDSDDPELYQIYLDTFPDGLFAPLALSRIEVLQGESRTSPATTPAVSSDNRIVSDPDNTIADPPAIDQTTTVSMPAPGQTPATVVVDNVEMQSLLDKAWAAFESKSLTTPEDDNAVKWAELVYEVDPDNEEAGKVLAAVIDTYLGWSEDKLNARSLSRARRYLNRARTLQQYVSPEQEERLAALSRKYEKERKRQTQRKRRRQTSSEEETVVESQQPVREAPKKNWLQRLDSRMQKFGDRMDEKLGNR